MTPDQQIAYVVAMAAVLNAQVAGMVAENQWRSHRGEVIAYAEDAFSDLIDKSGCHRNAVLATFGEGQVVDPLDDCCTICRRMILRSRGDS